MESALSLIGLAIVVFASTNIDDAFVLVGFLADKHFRVRDVVIGQYAGVSVICAVSAIAALISLAIPPAYIGLLGLIPIGIGAKNSPTYGAERRARKRIGKAFPAPEHSAKAWP
jgi:cadmium resistance protein CadD (predicted permease)